MARVTLNPAANDSTASSPALDPTTLISATKLRFQWSDAAVVNNITKPSWAVETPSNTPGDLAEFDGWTKPEVAVGVLALVSFLTFTGAVAASYMFVTCVALAVTLVLLLIFAGVAYDTTARVLDARAAAAGPPVEVPANVRDAWNRVRSVTATYAHRDGAVAPGSLLELERGSWLAVEEIAAHVQSGTLASAECVAAMDALFTAAAQADTYDLLRKHATQLEPAHSPAAALLATSDIDGTLALLAPAPVEPQAIPSGY